MITDPPGYLLASAYVQAKIHGIILLDDFEMRKKHFVDDFLLSLCVNQNVVASARDFLYLFFKESRDMVSVHCDY